MDEDWDDEQLAALDAAEAAVSSSSSSRNDSSSSRNDNDIASPQDALGKANGHYLLIARPFCIDLLGKRLFFV